MEIFGYHIKRLFVMATSIVILSLTATDLSHGDTTGLFDTILKYIVLFVSVAGFVGVLQHNYKYLNWFMLLLATLTVVKIAYILFSAFKLDVAATDVLLYDIGWDIAVAVLLAVATVQTADIIREPRYAGYTPVDEPLLG